MQHHAGQELKSCVAFWFHVFCFMSQTQRTVQDQ